jgi:hypothetical protein
MHMTLALRRRLLPAWAATPLRRFYFLGQFVAVGLLAIAVSGAICWGIAREFGKNAIAGDSQSVHLSQARCLDLYEYHPEAKSCASAELAHHSDEIIYYRLETGLLAAVAGAGVLAAGRLFRFSAGERRQQRAWHVLTGAVAFGGAAAVLLSFGLANIVRESSAGTGRWFSDGGVALAFCAMYATLWLTRGRAA